MAKLDRTVFSTNKLSDVRIESEHYTLYSEDEKHEVFAYLQSVAYNFPIHNWPKMDKTLFETRKING